MRYQFHVQVGTRWTFEVDSASLVGSVDGPDGTSRGDSSALVESALDSPIDFPSLKSASVPGDRIAIAADPLLPDALAALQGVAQGLVHAEADLDLVTFVLPAALADLQSELERDSAAQRGHAHVAVHNPSDRKALAYLAATNDGRPIYLNRLLCDADLVIPVTCVPPPTSQRWLGIQGSVYPTFSDEDAIHQFRAGLGRLSAAEQERRRKDVDEVGWLLGVSIVVGIVPGRNGSIFQATAGTPQRVAAHCAPVAEAGWRRELPRPAPLVISLVAPRGGELSWDDFAAALAAAGQTAGDTGAVAVCGNFTKRPGRSLHRLVDAADLARVEERLAGERHEDTWAALELASALQRGPVYFAGELNDDEVESLGMAPISRPEELARLASRFDECVVISDADIAAPYVAKRGSVA
jgi:hypothetical protein